MLHECHKNVTRVSQECYKSVTRVLQECYKRVTRVLQECLTWQAFHAMVRPSPVEAL